MREHGERRRRRDVTAQGRASLFTRSIGGGGGGTGDQRPSVTIIIIIITIMRDPLDRDGAA